MSFGLLCTRDFLALRAHSYQRVLRATRWTSVCGVVSALLFVISTHDACAQNFYWKDTAGNGRWDWGTSQWFSSSAGFNVGAPATNGSAIIWFENVGGTNTFINAGFTGGWFKLNSLYTAANSTGRSYVINVENGGTGIEVYNKIETISGGGALAINAATQLGANSEINAVGGSLTLGELRMNGQTLSSFGANSLNINGVISGTGAYNIKNQGITVTYSGSGTNTFSGTTTVENSSTLVLNKSANTAALAGSLIVNSGATVRTDSAGQLGNQFVTVNGTLNLNGNNQSLALAGTSNSASVALGSATMTVTNTGSDSFAGVISGSGGITKSGSGTLSLAGNNTYSGDTRITAGQLTVDAGGDLGDGETDVFISSGAQLNLNTSVIVDSVSQTGVDNGGTINLGTGATLTLDGADKGSLSQNSISGAGNLSVGASGTTALTLYGTQSYTGTTAVSGGKISTGVSLATSAVNVSGGTFEASAANILSGTAAVTISGTGTFALGGSDTVGSFTITGGALTTTNDATLTAATYILQGGTVGANLGTGTASASTGTTALNGTLGGNLTVNGGTVNLGSANRLADGASVTVSSSGTLGLGANDDTISSFALRNTATLGGSGTLTAATYSLEGGTVSAGLGAGAITVTTGTTTLGSAGRLNSASTLAVNSGQLNLGGAETVAGLSGSGGTVNLGAHTLTAAIASGTNTYAGAIIGTGGGLTKTGIGRLSLSGSSSYNGATAVSAGDLNLSGGSITNSAVTVASGASLSGYGSVGTIGGAGAINPGNSPGILTTPEVNPSGGTSFNFEMTGTAPTYSNAASSVNDLIQITGMLPATPFSQALTAGNGINIYFSGAALFTGSTAVQYKGGFFTDQSASFASSISGATYTYYFANASGTNSYNGANYYNKAQYESLILGTNMLITVSTVAQTANFGGGDINGQVMQVQVIPEPSTYALLGLSAAAFGAYRWRRRRG